MTVLALLGSCSNGGPKQASTPTPTTLEATTSSSSSSSSTTIVVVSTAVTSRPSTTSPALSPEAAAKRLYEAWARGDRAAAEKVAQPDAMTALFSRRWQVGDGWTFAECSGAAGSLICAWQRPSAQLLMRVQNVPGGLPVAEVRFQP